MSRKASLILFLVLLLTLVFVYSGTAANRITTPDKVGDVGKYSSLAFDANGYPVISYYQEKSRIDSYPGPGGTELTEHDLKIMHCNDRFCAGGNETITVPDQVGEVGTYTSLVLDKYGHPVVSYYDIGNSALKLLHCDDPYCDGWGDSITTPDTADGPGKWSSLVLDKKGWPVIAYHARGTLRLLHCNDPNCNGVGESITIPDWEGGEHISMVLDADGYPVISYRGSASRKLKLMHCNDVNCKGKDETITFPGFAKDCQGSSLALDAAGNPVISYLWNYDQYVLHCNDPDCAGGDESNSGPYLTPVGSNSSLALDASGNPVVSAWVLESEFSSTGHLEVLRCNDPNCDGFGERISGPDMDGNTGLYSSLVHNGAGLPVISFYKSYGANLRVLTCDTPTCAPAVEPKARFSVIPDQGKEPVTIHFVPESTGDYDSCLWDFGDGTTKSSCTDQYHTYPDSGYYTPSLTVSGWAGTDSKRCRRCVEVFEQVVADFSVSPIFGPPPLEVTFENLSIGDYTKCAWDFGDGNSSSSCNKVTNVYGSPGKYTVKLRVEGPGGMNTKRVRHAVSVSDTPLADFVASPSSGPPPLVVAFEDQSLGQVDQCTWDFGDGVTVTTHGHPKHKYTEEGRYTVSMTAHGPTGDDTATKQELVVVEYYRSYIPGIVNR